MRRRDFLKTAGGSVLALVSTRTRCETPKIEKPNLLVIHTDQQSCWTLGAYSGDLVDTPHVDSLAREGVAFDNFFTNSPVCTPSRGCFLTGRYPLSHGAFRNNIEINRDEITFAQALKDNGYDTGYAGKWHLDGVPKPGWLRPERSMGFTDCRYIYNRGHWKKIVDEEEENPEVQPYKVIGDEKTYTTDWLTEKTIDFIKRPRRNPFCYMVSIPDPHTPFTVREPYDTMFNPEDMTFPENVPADLRPKLAPKKAQYCGMVKCIDDNVGRIIDCLKKEGIYDNTIVVFTTDHGEYMGEHGLMGKSMSYETAIRIPMIIRFPGRIPAGKRIDNVASTVDFQPTILNLMDVETSGREQGRNATPLIKGEKIEWEDAAFIHHASLKGSCVFTKGYELAYNNEGREGCLFDRKNDPCQLENLFDDDGHKDVVDRLTRELIEHNNKFNEPVAKWLKRIVES